MVGPVGVELVLPTGFCELDPSRFSDAQLIAQYTPQLARGGNKILGISAAVVVGVDDDDPNGCYTAVLQKLRTQRGTEKLQLMIDTIVAIKGKILFSSLFIPYVDMEGVAKSLAENRGFVATWRAANGM